MHFPILLVLELWVVCRYFGIVLLYSASSILDISDDEDDYDADCEDIDSKLMPPPPPPTVSAAGKKEEPVPPTTNGKD